MVLLVVRTRYGRPMATASGRVKRQRGEIEESPSGSLRVKVYAGIDPITKKRHYLTETIPAGPTARKEAEKSRTRFLAQVDDRRNPRTRATVDQLLDRQLAEQRPYVLVQLLDVPLPRRRLHVQHFVRNSATPQQPTTTRRDRLQRSDHQETSISASPHDLAEMNGSCGDLP